jgi:hypothetical protein
VLQFPFSVSGLVHILISRWRSSSRLGQDKFHFSRAGSRARQVILLVTLRPSAQGQVFPYCHAVIVARGIPFFAKCLSLSLVNTWQIVCKIVVALLTRSIVCGLLQGEVGIVLESPDKKTRVFLIQMKLTPRSLIHAYKVFGEIPMRIWAAF